MNPKTKRPYQTLSSRILWICLYLTLLGSDLGCGYVIKEELKSGRTYSPGVVLGFDHFVFRDNSPNLYWGFISLYVFCFMIGIAVIAFGVSDMFKNRK